MSTHELLGNYTAQSQTARTLRSGIVDLRRFQNVYISSANLSSFKALGPRGKSNIILKFLLQLNTVLQYLTILLLVMIGLM